MYPMSYGIMYDVPADERMFANVRAAIGDEQPEGLVVHLVTKTDSGLRHIGIWRSQNDWQRFYDERVRPAVHRVLAEAGITPLPPDPIVHELKLVDVSIGA